MFTGDELFSDIYKIRVINDVLYEVEGKVGIVLQFCVYGTGHFVGNTIIVVQYKCWYI